MEVKITREISQFDENVISFITCYIHNIFIINFKWQVVIGYY